MIMFLKIIKVTVWVMENNTQSQLSICLYMVMVYRLSITNIGNKHIKNQNFSNVFTGVDIKESVFFKLLTFSVL